MKVNCPSCQREIPAVDINIQSAIAKCSACDEYFTLASIRAGVAHEMQKPLVPQPSEIMLIREGNTLVIQWGWFTWGNLFLTVFAAYWDTTMYNVIISSTQDGQIPYFILFHVAAGVYFTYLVLTGYLNKSQIRITQNSIMVQHGPLPWPGNKIVSTESIIQLFCALTPKVPLVRGNIPTYDVWVLYQDRLRVKLVSRISTAPQALYIEQQLEAALGIEDYPVAGELKAV